MTWQKIGEGGILEAGKIYDLEKDEVPEGSHCLLKLNLRFTPGQELIEDIENAMNSHGIVDARVSSGSPTLNISWRKAELASLIVIGIILALVLAIMIVGWSFFKEAPVTFNLALIAGVGLVGLVLVNKLTRKGEKVK